MKVTDDPTRGLTRRPRRTAPNLRSGLIMIELSAELFELYLTVASAQAIVVRMERDGSPGSTERSEAERGRRRRCANLRK
jgi:hypothetical protein